MPRHSPHGGIFDGRGFFTMFRFKKIIPAVIFLSTISAISFGFNSTNYCQTPKKVWKIAIFRTKPPYAIEQERELKKSLKRLGYIEGKTIIYLPSKIVKSTVEDFAETAVSVKEILTLKPDIIATIGTQASVPTWQILEHTDIPMVFAGVTYPVKHGLIKAFGKPTGNNITGISYAVPVKKRLELIRKMFPDVNRYRSIAFIYSGQVLQDFTYMKNLKSLDQYERWKFIYINYFDYAQNSPSYKLLIKKLKQTNPDLAFGWYSLDHLGADAINFKRLLNEFGKPIISITADQLDEGAIGGILTSHSALSFKQAKMIDKIIKGEKAGNIPPVEPIEYLIELNLKKARYLGVEFDPNLIDKADRIIQ